ncbi:MAG: putative Nudix hydrolase NudL [Promethearchaeota archaeon]|nr:MAG: putative Nudix hydrolase NudL [Candidatus Lokiarchaeota archaeon]
MNLIYDEELIRAKLYDFHSSLRVNLSDEFFTVSAVLFSIIPYEDRSYDLVLIQRTNRGRNHRGEMSFPGGRFEKNVDRSVIDTALRETEEEIGVSRNEIELLGCMNDFPTMTKYIITPIVGKIDAHSILVKEEKEVKEIVKIPINFFVNKRNFKEQAFKVENEKFPIFYFNYYDDHTKNKYLIWGATAYMIVSFIERIYDYNMSKLELERFSVEKIRSIKEYIKYRKNITQNIK